MLEDMANEPTQATLNDLDKPLEARYIAGTQYINKYLYQIEHYPPKSDAKIWKMMAGRTAEYYHSIKIRGAAAAQGEELNRHCQTDMLKRKYAARDLQK